MLGPRGSTPATRSASRACAGLLLP
ncbi:DUF3649 domain-containing protein [Paenibacillus solanacearum]